VKNRVKLRTAKPECEPVGGSGNEPRAQEIRELSQPLGSDDSDDESDDDCVWSTVDGELRTVSTTAAAAATAAAAVPRDVNGRAGPALTPSRRGDYPLIGFLCLFAPRTPVS
jgi:hypothetical protein